MAVTQLFTNDQARRAMLKPVSLRLPQWEHSSLEDVEPEVCVGCGSYFNLNSPAAQADGRQLCHRCRKL